MKEDPNWNRNPDWPSELAQALGGIAIQFSIYEFIFSHLVAFAEGIDKNTLYRDVLPLTPSQKIDRLRNTVRDRTDDISRVYSTFCDQFEVVLTDRNRYIHAYWYRFPDNPNEFLFVDIHGKKDKLNKETHRCTVRDIKLVSMDCARQVNNLQILRSIPETAEFFNYLSLPDAAPIPGANPRKIPFDHRKKA